MQLISKKYWRTPVRFIAPILLVMGGIVLLLTGHFSGLPYKASGLTQLQASTTTTTVAAQKQMSGVPIRITVNQLGIDLPLDKGFYNSQDQTWTLSNIHAQYAVVTPPANTQGGNTFIYGHDTTTIFAKLNQIKSGDMVRLTTNNEHYFYYKYRSAIDVNPKDTSLFGYLGKPILTVQTCSGSWYQNRRLFVFDFVRAT